MRQEIFCLALLVAICNDNVTKEKLDIYEEMRTNW